MSYKGRTIIFLKEGGREIFKKKLFARSEKTQQPRPQGAFLSKAREKRPGDEVEDKIKCLQMLWGKKKMFSEKPGKMSMKNIITKTEIKKKLK